MSGEITDPRFAAAVRMIGRTGATAFSIRYSDDEQPVVWLAIASYGDRHEVDAAFDPVRAVLRLAERLIDGAQCAHCKRLAASTETMPLHELVCWYQFDPELRTFRRGCEGN